MEVSNQDVLHTLNQRARTISKSLNTHLKEHRLYAAQWSILFCLHTFGSMTQTDIWKYLNVEPPTVTRTLVKMEENGWIVRKQGDDKRERIIELTAEAESQFPMVKQSVINLENELLGQLTQDEKNQLYVLLNKIE